MYETAYEALQVWKKCKHAENCAYSHKEDTNNKENNEHLVSIKNSLKELQVFKNQSEVKIKSLEEELKLVKSKKGKEQSTDSSLVSRMNKLEVEFEQLKSEFELLKLCRINQKTKTVQKKAKEASSNAIKCTKCDLTFQTGSGLKVHIDLEHPTQIVIEADLRCKHCVITCSDQIVMNKHILREHKFKCTKCIEAFQEESMLTAHISNAHSGVDKQQ